MLTYLLIGLTIALVALIDYIPRFLLKAKKPIVAQSSQPTSPDFLIMPTVYGSISYLENIEFLKPYTNKVVICTSVHESPQFYSDLQIVCQKYGFRYLACEVPIVGGKPVKNAYTIYRGAFPLLDYLPYDKHIPCLLMDADTYALEPLANLINAFVANGLDIASLRCEVANPQTIVEKLQAFEYSLAMDNRQIDPWLTSGACNLGRRQVYQHVFSQHSNFFAGGDIEIGKLAQVMGYKVGHIDFTFYTQAPKTIKAWFKQRIIWFSGGVRHHLANSASYSWHHFFIFFYNTLVIYLLWPLRWIELVNFPATFVALIIVSWMYTFILVGRKKWQPYLLLLPAYAFTQSMVIIPIGVFFYVKLVYKQRSFGFLSYDFRHISLWRRGIFIGLNIASVCLVGYIAYAFTLLRVQYWMAHGYIFHLMHLI
jgi:hypothetical protein